MTRVIVNRCYGGFGISDKAFEWLMDNKDWRLTEYIHGQYEDPTADIVYAGSSFAKYYFVGNDENLRTNPDLIECVETLGEEANGSCAKLQIVEIPDDVEWEIEENDGNEWVSEVHRTW